MTNPGVDRQNLEVLIVEDDNLSARLVESVIKTMGVSKVEIAVDGSKALSKVKLKQQPYDLIISDLDMPIMNGLDFVKAIRADYPSTTIVMLTAHTDTKAFNEAKRLGVEYFFMKPIAPPMLRMRLSAVLDVAAEKKSN